MNAAFLNQKQPTQTRNTQIYPSAFTYDSLFDRQIYTNQSRNQMKQNSNSNKLNPQNNHQNHEQILNTQFLEENNPDDYAKDISEILAPKLRQIKNKKEDE